jgi:adenylate cyclase
MSETRKLAAIMFTDIKGYTSLMSKDEQKAMQLLQKNRGIQTTLAEKHNGEYLKEMGDGTLLCFQSALDAVHCALEIQQTSKDISDLKLRIGIHLGDILFKEGDVFGEGVNVASRIEPLAEIGGVCISDQVYQLIRNQKGIEAVFIGEKSLKNVNHPVRVYTIANQNQSGESRHATMIDHIEPERKSIAVLPFTNMSTDIEPEYFCDGIAEDILNDLTSLEDLHVVARTSSFAFKGQNLDIREIGMKLGAQTIVEGSVRKAGNRLRISAQLINVSDGYHLWSERYDREMEDVFAIQDEIAKSIVQALEAKLSMREKRALDKIQTQDVEAYDFYMRGRMYFHKIHFGKLHLAIQMFQKAIQKDKKYALAYAGLADSYSFMYMWFDSRQEILEFALQASEMALELDSELAEAYTSRGLALTQNAEFDKAESEFETAITLNPKSYNAYYQYARTCKAQGKLERTIELFKKASEIRPEDYEAPLFLSDSYRDLNLKDEAKNANERALYLVRKHLELNPEDTRALYLGAGVLVKAGENEEALEWVEKALKIDPEEMGVLYNAACIYSLLGKHKKALDTFEKRIDAGHVSKEWIAHDSDFDPIRNHPRFQKALKKIK